jgi:hypothetical protein
MLFNPLHSMAVRAIDIRNIGGELKACERFAGLSNRRNWHWAALIDVY